MVTVMLELEILEIVNVLGCDVCIFCVRIRPFMLTFNAIDILCWVNSNLKKKMP